MSIVQVFDQVSFFKECNKQMLYVAFLKSPEVWFPLCYVTDSSALDKFDAIFVSESYAVMDEVAKAYAEKIPQVEQAFVKCLMREELQNLLEMYGLKSIALAMPESARQGCGCDCGCT